MIDINEEEISRLHGKLLILKECIRIRNLGYEYPKNSYVTIDMMCEMDGYGSVDLIEVINGIIGSSVGDGYCNYTESVKDELIALGGEIPCSTYDTDSILGFTININNKDTKKFIKYKMELSEKTKRIIKSIESDLCFDEATIDEAQFIVDYKNESGFYIIVPEYYYVGDYFIFSYVELLQNIRNEVEEYERNMKSEKEAA